MALNLDRSHPGGVAPSLSATRVDISQSLTGRPQGDGAARWPSEMRPRSLRQAGVVDWHPWVGARRCLTSAFLGYTMGEETCLSITNVSHVGGGEALPSSGLKDTWCGGLRRIRSWAEG